MEEIQRIKNNAHEIAEKMRELFPAHKEFLKLDAQIKAAGYRVEQDGGQLKIWKQI